MSSINTLEQNGVVKRKHTYIIDVTLSFLLSVSISIEFWGEVVLIVVHLINKIALSDSFICHHLKICMTILLIILP